MVEVEVATEKERMRARAMGALDDDHAGRRLRVIQQTSPSQVDPFERCQRIFFWERVAGFRSPSTDAQERGKDVDDNYVQPYLKTGEVRGGEWSGLLQKLIPHLPAPGPRQSLVVQARAEFEAYEGGGPRVLGFADWIEEVRPGHVRIGDLKTTSDFKYCKSSEELGDNTQMVTYARWAYETLGATGVEVGHVYARTGKGRSPQAHAGARPHPFGSKEKECRCPECRAWLSQVNRGQPVPSGFAAVSRAEVEIRWNARVSSIKEMQGVARFTEKAEDLPPSTDQCGAYGGCPHRARCGLNTIGAALGRQKGDDMGLSLMDRLKASNEHSIKKVEERVHEDFGEETVPGKVAAIIEKVSQAVAKAKASPESVKVLDSELSAARAAIAAGTLKLDGSGQVFCKEGADAGWIMRPPTVAESMAFSGAVKPQTSVQLAAPDAVLPPDAPARESTPEEVAALEASKKPRRKKKDDPTLPGIRVTATCDACDQKYEVALGHHCPEKPERKEISKLTAEEEKELLERAVRETIEGRSFTSVDVVPKGSGIMDGPKGAQGTTNGKKRPPVAPVLYVDCVPVKGGASATPLEVWLAPIAELCAKVHVGKDGDPEPVADWRMISYTAKGELAHVIRETIETCPAALLIDSRQSGADVALECLVPWAAQVVRGLR